MLNFKHLQNTDHTKPVQLQRKILHKNFRNRFQKLVLTTTQNHSTLNFDGKQDGTTERVLDNKMRPFHTNSKLKNNKGMCTF